MSAIDGVQSTSGSSGFRAANNNVPMDVAANAGRNDAKEQATSLLKDKGITEQTASKGLKDSDGNQYTFTQARDRVADMVQDKEAAGTSSEKRAIDQEIDKFVNELKDSLKPAEEAAPPAAGEAPAPAAAPAAAAPAAAPAADGLPPEAMGALDAISGDEMLGMLGEFESERLKDLIQTMKDAGATPEQIKAALKEKAAKAIEAKGGSPAEVAAAGQKIDTAVDKSFAASDSGSASSSTTGSVASDTVKTYA